MPERVFKYQSTEELIRFARALGEAMVSGSTVELRNNHSGWTRSVKALSAVELKNALRQVRFEIYIRGTPPDGSAPDLQCQALEPKNPLQERTMAVETITTVPAYLLPPFNSGQGYW